MLLSGVWWGVRWVDALRWGLLLIREARDGTIILEVSSTKLVSWFPGIDAKVRLV
jgi:hypothetical protein